MAGDHDLAIGVLARRSGVHIETIRYYEKIGLLPAPPRTGGGHRAYSDLHLKRLIFIRRSRELGFRLEEIRTLLGLADAGASCGEVRQTALAHVDDIRSKIADLKRMETTLASAGSINSARSENADKDMERTIFNGLIAEYLALNRLEMRHMLGHEPVAAVGRQQNLRVGRIALDLLP